MSSPEIARPGGIPAVAGVFFLASAYLIALALIRLIAPGAVPLSWAAPLLHGLELAGPFMFLLAGGVGAVVAWGLLRMNNWARWLAILACLLGVVMLVPGVSGAVIYFDFARLAWGGLGVILRVAMTWYLFQEPVVAAFRQE